MLSRRLQASSNLCVMWLAVRATEYVDVLIFRMLVDSLLVLQLNVSLKSFIIVYSESI